ncbi:MAG: type II toxin-antitoxin system RelE/ParE family toxin [Desulfobacterales bacterium]|nr:type II toxin-antitoxin system RelE/ParE family toxin [Desulfobacterales bacterium]
MKPVIIHKDAKSELFEAIAWHDAKSYRLGLDFAREVERAIQYIREDPKRWPEKKNKTRRYLLQKFPYAIFYIDRKDDIWVVAIAHTKRKPYYWKKRSVG